MLLFFSKDVGFFDVIFEGNALQVVREINSDPLYASCIGHIVESIKHELVFFRFSCVVYAHRETNCAAHNLAKEVISCRQIVVSLEDIPSSILSIVLREQVVPRS
jgi:hypothetical protein